MSRGNFGYPRTRLLALRNDAQLLFTRPAFADARAP